MNSLWHSSCFSRQRDELTCILRTSNSLFSVVILIHPQPSLVRSDPFSLLLDGERWKQADVPTEIQSLAQQLEAGVAMLIPHIHMSHISFHSLSL